jgi:predicted GNAT family N-acyltransferase
MADPSIRITHFDPEKDPGDFHAALAIREVVFIEEQSVPESIERDAEDARAWHVLAWDGPHAVGTGRLVEIDAPEGKAGRWGQIGRMAVLTANRKHGIGASILGELEEEAKRRGLAGVKLHAQVAAMGFYEKMGYRRVGDEFEEAGMPHVEAHKSL